MANRNFWQTTLLYLYRPNLINRRVIGAKVIKIWQCPNQNLQEILTILSDTTIRKLKNSILIECNSLKPENILDQLLNQLVDCAVIVLRKLYRKQSLKSLTESNKKIKYDFMILFPSLNKFTLLSVDVLGNGAEDDDHDEYSDHVPINIRRDDIAFTLNLIDDTSATIPNVSFEYLFEMPTTNSKNSSNWLENVFKPKFERWLKGSETAKNQDDNNDVETKATPTSFEGSIRNISVENYCQNYNRLKEKYVSPLMNIWSKVEKTDPIKFIYEDVAIAAYLITLWQKEMEKFSLNQRQTFADIGCGNGLLVYILSNEGYNGYGIDIRKRNIWNFYGNDINLIEMRIDLFDEQNNIAPSFDLPPCDWVIGNHSDELTPWIIYMAASTTPFTRAFILPCCCYDFDGFKFQRTTLPNTSQYQCYINFLEQLCQQFGFECFRDKLRIPSTKRICLVCHNRTYLNNYDKLLKQKNFLTNEQIENLRSIESEWNEKRKQIVEKSLQSRPKVRLREKEEKVRNCSRIDLKIKEKIISKLASALYDKSSSSLSSYNNVEDYDDNCISFKEAINLLDDELRIHLKNQCGGLQTFIRNHKHIFTIVPNGITFQKVDYLIQQRKQFYLNNRIMKTKECWFYKNHPKGCPLMNIAANNGDDPNQQNQCPFKH